MRGWGNGVEEVKEEEEDEEEEDWNVEVELADAKENRTRKK